MANDKPKTANPKLKTLRSRRHNQHPTTLNPYPLNAKLHNSN